MNDEDVDPVVTAARAELQSNLNPTPPEFDHLVRRFQRRRRGLAGAAAALVLAAIAVPVALAGQDSASQIVAGPAVEEPNRPGSSGAEPEESSVSVSTADLLGPGETRPLAESPLAGRSTMAAVWTGQEMLIWGGDSVDGQFDDGATYDPLTDTWTMLPDSPLKPRNAPAAVWTGEEVLLWGGSTAPGDQVVDPDDLRDAPGDPSGAPDNRDGAAYNPTTRTWRSIADAPVATAGRPVGVWTGSEMIVLAGFNSRDAAAYDPANDRWRTLPDLPGQLQAPNPVGVWTGEQVVTVVQPTGIEPGGAPTVVSLQPAGDSWTSQGDLGFSAAALAWSGETLLVAAGNETFELQDGKRQPVATAPPGWQQFDAPGVWTGSELLLWNGDTASTIDPTAGTWKAIPSGDTVRRIQPALVWANGVLLAWGGFPNHDGGVMLRPPAD